MSPLQESNPLFILTTGVCSREHLGGAFGVRVADTLVAEGRIELANAILMRDASLPKLVSASKSGEEGNRTPDILFAGQTLYRLSYFPVEPQTRIERAYSVWKTDSLPLTY